MRKESEGDMSDLVERLRKVCYQCGWVNGQYQKDRRASCNACKERAEAADKIALLQAIVDKLPKRADGTLYESYVEGQDATGFAVWRSVDGGPLRVSPARKPDPDWHCGYDWEIDDADDVCDVVGVYSTLEAAEKAREQ